VGGPDPLPQEGARIGYYAEAVLRGTTQCQRHVSSGGFHLSLGKVSQYSLWRPGRS